MSNKKTVGILDACTIINIFAIDEDDFLVKSLFKSIDVFICEEVLKEVRINFTLKKQLADRKKEVERILPKFMANQIYDSEVKSDCGEGYFSEIKKITQYTKDNGEFYSCAIALYKSQIDEIKLIFYTDDTPASDEFGPFFYNNQIGHIEDAADLLLFLYRLNDEFTDRLLDRFLDFLYIEYSKKVSSLLNKLRNINSSINNSAKHRRFKHKKELHELIKKLERRDFCNLFDLKKPLGTHLELKELLNEYDFVFQLNQKDETKRDFFKKITQIRTNLKNGQMYNVLA